MAGRFSIARGFSTVGWPAPAADTTSWTCGVKGGQWRRKMTPLLHHAVTELIGDRTEGLISVTDSGRPLDEPSVWQLLRSLPLRASLAAIPLHTLKGEGISNAMEQGRPLADVQDGLCPPGAAHHPPLRPAPPPTAPLPRLWLAYRLAISEV